MFIKHISIKLMIVDPFNNGTSSFKFKNYKHDLMCSHLNSVETSFFSHDSCRKPLSIINTISFCYLFGKMMITLIRRNHENSDLFCWKSKVSLLYAKHDK